MGICKHLKNEYLSMKIERLQHIFMEKNEKKKKEKNIFFNANSLCFSSQPYCFHTWAKIVWQNLEQLSVIYPGKKTYRLSEKTIAAIPLPAVIDH